jgi:hypothetical protein
MRQAANRKSVDHAVHDCVHARGGQAVRYPEAEHTDSEPAETVASAAI